MKIARAHSPAARQAALLLGQEVRAARRERRWTLEELAERAGTTAVTMRKVERGDLSVGLGVAFEAAALLGVPLFHDSQGERARESRRIDDRLALLPQSVRQPTKVSNDF